MSKRAVLKRRKRQLERQMSRIRNLRDYESRMAYAELSGLLGMANDSLAQLAGALPNEHQRDA